MGHGVFSGPVLYRNQKVKKTASTLPAIWSPFCRVPLTSAIEWINRMNQTIPAAASQASRTQREPDARAPLVCVKNLEKTYRTARGTLTLFQGLNLEVLPGELVAIVGQSGAGKSTLLHILGALDRATTGTVHCASTNVASLGQREAAAFRNREIGYVWQFHYLLPEFTALENVAMPLLARGQKDANRWLLHLIGLERSIWKTAATIGRGSYPAGSNSESHWRARWWVRRGCC